MKDSALVNCELMCCQRYSPNRNPDKFSRVTWPGSLRDSIAPADEEFCRLVTDVSEQSIWSDPVQIRFAHDDNASVACVVAQASTTFMCQQSVALTAECLAFPVPVNLTNVQFSSGTPHSQMRDLREVDEQYPSLQSSTIGTGQRRVCERSELCCGGNHRDVIFPPST